ncbi:ATP-binding protein [Chryseobacterium indoltheticum]|uniref:ATP-binding protein n=1 Tax=Chryseobacterium indoltheticum TaxID=254 RepID=UPI003F493A5A
MSQVTHNLIGNAIKYSPINTSITVEYITTDDNSLKINVKDQGIGISREDQERIFERYYRVKDINSRSTSGFGIGLYLAKKLSNCITVQ